MLLGATSLHQTMRPCLLDVAIHPQIGTRAPQPSKEDILMSAHAKSEDRLLEASELEIVTATRSPAIKQLTVAQLKTLIRRLRQAHGRAKDISARQQREMRGKAAPRGAKRVRGNTGSIAKVKVLFEAIRRVDGEFSRRDEKTTTIFSQAELSRRALEQKLRSRPKQYPRAGRSASKGLRPKQRKTPTKVGTTPEGNRPRLPGW